MNFAFFSPKAWHCKLLTVSPFLHKRRAVRAGWGSTLFLPPPRGVYVSLCECQSQKNLLVLLLWDLSSFMTFKIKDKPQSVSFSLVNLFPHFLLVGFWLNIQNRIPQSFKVKVKLSISIFLEYSTGLWLSINLCRSLYEEVVSHLHVCRLELRQNILLH